MKSIILAVAMFLVAVPATETLTQAERDKGIAELEGSKKAFLDATRGFRRRSGISSLRRTGGPWRSVRTTSRLRKGLSSGGLPMA